MDAVAFNTYTEFFTHTHSICHFLQSEAWQSRAENTMHRLTESSAGVAEQLQSTRQMAEDLIEAQSAALQAQQEILDNGEELRVTLRDSTQGLRSIFLELSSVSREQQVALSELFNRVSFLQSFLMVEAHSMSSCLYNAAALCASFLLTSTQRSSRARLMLLGLVCLNFYLERKIYQFVLSSDHPEHQHMELVSVYVSVLRQVMVFIGVCVLLRACVRYQDPVQEVLQQLRETQNSLQEALQHAGEFCLIHMDQYLTHVDRYLIQMDQCLIQMDQYLTQMDQCLTQMDRYLTHMDRYLIQMDQCLTQMDQCLTQMDQYLIHMDQYLIQIDQYPSHISD
ncbi:uncharacterized protein LOC115422035 [Sphaeramia orbicularis]|uniref:uncharacterized protein LOC115422035 n=1 Tax=Sphaeramia orbicularis TaxID=375764 RepID=UPI00117FFDE1|nr:uncharacterized protein LOC115422035 [Sphaeramia orbicularis]